MTLPHNCRDCRDVIQDPNEPLCKKCVLQMIQSRRPSFLKETTSETPLEHRKCRKCPTVLAHWIRYYCSYQCIEAAKVAGEYGNEELVAKES